MKAEQPRESWYERFLRWAEGGEPDLSQEVAEDPERTEFMEYLEYLDSHEHIDFGAYRLMRYKELAAKGLLPQSGAGHEQPQAAPAPSLELRLRHKPGRFRHLVWGYRVLSVGVAALPMLTLVLVSLAMPGFGDPNAPALNEVPQRYLEQGTEETGAINAVTGMILDYRAFDTFGESTVLFAASVSTALLLSRESRREEEEERP